MVEKVANPILPPDKIRLEFQGVTMVIPSKQYHPSIKPLASILFNMTMATADKEASAKWALKRAVELLPHLSAEARKVF